MGILDTVLSLPFQITAKLSSVVIYEIERLSSIVIYEIECSGIEG